MTGETRPRPYFIVRSLKKSATRNEAASLRSAPWFSNTPSVMPFINNYVGMEII
jgi:hypothetical protein